MKVVFAHRAWRFVFYCSLVVIRARISLFLVSKTSVLIKLSSVVMLMAVCVSFLISLAFLVTVLTEPVAMSALLLGFRIGVMGTMFLGGFTWGALAIFIVFLGGVLVALVFISSSAFNWSFFE